MEIGTIFHFGLYSVYQFDDVKSARRRIIKNGSEWYFGRLIEKSTYRPISGHNETKQHHLKYFNNSDYFDVKSQFDSNFNSTKKNIIDWINLSLKIGATYTIITAKHHDGFCLWPSKHAKHCSKNDIVDFFIKYAKQKGLKVGLYFSLCEFNEKSNIDYIDNILNPQMNELLKYDIDIVWFDGNWTFNSKYAQTIIDNICDKLKQKKCIINDRIAVSNTIKKLYNNKNYLHKSNYRNYKDRYIPNDVPNVPWESIITIGLSWGKNNQQTHSDYMSSEELYNHYVKVKEKNGNLLINLAPDGTGKLDKYEVNIIKKFALKIEN